jgi:excinuclease ABC subunit C
MTEKESIASKPDLTHFPATPGVYLMFDESEEIIYVGKAINLKKRVTQYFNGSNKDTKTRFLVKRIASIDYITCRSEMEALLLECNLIKKHRPRYNIDLKDNKTYPYIKVTNEPFPRIYKTRQKIKDGSSYFGPYPNVHIVRHNLIVLHKMFYLRTCKKKLPANNQKPCLNYHIGKCKGYCLGNIDPEAYQKNIQTAKLFLKGHYSKLITQLKSEMRDMSNQLRFEEAAAIRDQINSIIQINERQSAIVDDKSDLDVFGIFITADKCTIAVINVREGKILKKLSFNFDLPLDLSKFWADFLKQYIDYTDDLATELVLPEPPEDKELLVKYLTKKKDKTVKITIPKSGKRYELIEMANQNAMFSFQEQEKVTKKELVLMDLKKILCLNNEPRRIEGFDIANIQGKYAYASMVSFKDGVPDKRNYRLFRITTKDIPDDFEMMREAVSRRYQRVLNDNLTKPDLILIDGGKGQLNVARNVLKALGLDIPILGLAKREEEIFLNDAKEPIRLPKNSKALNLLQEVRDEAHRFGNSAHRRLRNKSGLESLLDRIPGIGPARRKTLYKQFKSIKAISEANIEQLATVDKISKSIAEKVYNFLHNENQQM